MNFDIVIPTCNSEKRLSRCIPALAAVHYPIGQFHVVIADNASQDGTLQEAKRLQAIYTPECAFGSFSIAENSINAGFGAACNLGAKRGNASVILFLQPDTEPDAGMFEQLEKAIRTAPDSAAAFECRQVPYETAHYMDPVTMEVPYADGACLAVRRTAFEAVGGFDERIFLYCGDIDLSWRLRAKGYHLYYVPHAKVTHYCYPEGAPRAAEYAGGFFGAQALRLKYGTLKEIRAGRTRYRNAMNSRPEADAFRTRMQENRRRIRTLLPLFFWRFSHREEFKSRVSLFSGTGFGPDRGLYGWYAPQDTPLVSLLIRTYNRPETLRLALTCLRHQTNRNFEVIVAEDGEPLAKKMVEEEFSDLDIHYINDGIQHGMSANSNRAMAAARGEYMNYLDDDDFLFPDHIEMLAGMLTAHPEADMVFGTAFAVYQEDDGTIREVRPLRFDRIDRFTMCQNCRVAINSVMFRRRLYDRYGGVPETLQAHDDWAQWLKYMEHATRITPHKHDIERITTVYTQIADPEAFAAHIKKYSVADQPLYHEKSLHFDMTMADLRRYYDDMIGDLRLMEQKGTLHDFLEQESHRND